MHLPWSIYIIILSLSSHHGWDHTERETSGPWTTLLTWETNTFSQSYVYTVMLIKRKKVVISFLRIKWSFICESLSSLHIRMLCAKFGGNWPSGFGVEDFKFYQHIFPNQLLPPLGKVHGPSNPFNPIMLCPRINLTKVRPLFSLSHRESVNSPLLIMFSANYINKSIVIHLCDWKYFGSFDLMIWVDYMPEVTRKHVSGKWLSSSSKILHCVYLIGQNQDTICKCKVLEHDH